MSGNSFEVQFLWCHKNQFGCHGHIFFRMSSNVGCFQIKCSMVQLSGRCIACVDNFHLEGSSPVKDGYLTISLCNSVARTLSRLGINAQMFLFLMFANKVLMSAHFWTSKNLWGVSAKSQRGLGKECRTGRWCSLDCIPKRKLSKITRNPHNAAAVLNSFGGFDFFPQLAFS